MPAEQEESERRELDLRIPARAIMVSRVRLALAELGLPYALLDDARLLASELVANGIRHSGLTPDGEIRITASWSGSTLRVDVHDRNPTSAATPVSGSIRPDPGAESGWGLYLVERISTRWGATPGRYWFELDTGEEQA